MMRRNSTRRLVHALSSGSIRSEEIAATDIAPSRAFSRDRSRGISRAEFRAEASDMADGLEIGARCGWEQLHAAESWPAGTVKSIADELRPRRGDAALP